MKIYIVMKCVEYESSSPVSAHVDKSRADAAAKAIDRDVASGYYGMVESVELDTVEVQDAAYGPA